MSSKIKATLYAYGIFFVIFLIIWLVIHNLFQDLSSPILGAITAMITVLLAPQRQVIKTQSGEKVQLKWLFSKRVIHIK